jgi:uncharacterized protein (DUF3084 family)
VQFTCPYLPSCHLMGKYEGERKTGLNPTSIGAPHRAPMRLHARAGDRTRTEQPPLYKSGALPIELRRPAETAYSALEPVVSVIPDESSRERPAHRKLDRRRGPSVRLAPGPRPSVLGANQARERKTRSPASAVLGAVEGTTSSREGRRLTSRALAFARIDLGRAARDVKAPIPLFA